jgi:hypothetical protein
MTEKETNASLKTRAQSAFSKKSATDFQLNKLDKSLTKSIAKQNDYFKLLVLIQLGLFLADETQMYLKDNIPIF